MKTMREWLMTIEDETIRTQAIENMERHHSKTPDVIVALRESLHDAVMCAFVWGKTEQRFMYWNEIHNAARNGTLK